MKEKTRDDVIQASIILLSAILISFTFGILFHKLSISFFALLGIAYSFNMVDVITSHLIISDAEEELNPVAGFLFEKFGIFIGGLVLKNIIFAIFIIIVFIINPTGFYLKIYYYYLLPSFLLSVGFVASLNNIVLWNSNRKI